MSAQSAKGRSRRNRDERGFTLVEMVIALALASGVAIIGTTIFMTALRGDEQVHSTSRATIQAQSIAQGIERSVRNAQRIAISGSSFTVWTTLDGSRTCQQWSVAGSGASATIRLAEAATTPGTGADFAGAAAIKGATLSVSDASFGGYAGVTYAVTLPSETRPVKVAGTVRSRTTLDTSTMASAATCGL